MREFYEHRVRKLAVKSLQYYDCYLQLGLLMFMMTSFVVRFNFVFMMFWVTILKFGMNPMEEA